MSAAPSALAAEFPQPSVDDWRALVTRVLRSSGVAPQDISPEAPEMALASTTADGVVVRPLYTRELGALRELPPDRRAAGSSAAEHSAGWDVRQRHADPDPARTNAAVLDDLRGGATSLWLVLGERGTPVDSLARALDGVLLDLAPVVLDAGAATPRAAEALLALAERAGADRAALRGSLGADPIGAAARTGEPVLMDALTDVARMTEGTGLTAITVDGSAYADAGASDSDELAAAAAAGVAYLRVLTAAGVPDPFAQLEFRYAVGVDQFGGIAKLRAAQEIWARVGELSGVRTRQRQHAVTARASLTRRDPWTNLLRGTIACFAAAVAGAEAITVFPFDAALGVPDGFGRRLARNTSSILHDESSLARVLDPAGGSWYVESLTAQLADVAWSKFTALERAGGAVRALESGVLVDLVRGSRDTRRDRVARRLEPIIGVSRYPLLDEPPLARPAAPPAPVGGLPPIRWAADFEAIRDRADRYLRRTGHRPAVALVALGSPASTAAAARAFFELGGIDAVEDPERMRGHVTCVLGPGVADDQVAAAVTAARAGGARRVMVAGSAPASVAVDDVIDQECDAVRVLSAVLDELGVQ